MSSRPSRVALAVCIITPMRDFLIKPRGPFQLNVVDVACATIGVVLTVVVGDLLLAALGA